MVLLLAYHANIGVQLISKTKTGCLLSFEASVVNLARTPFSQRSCYREKFDKTSPSVSKLLLVQSWREKFSHDEEKEKNKNWQKVHNLLIVRSGWPEYHFHNHFSSHHCISMWESLSVIHHIGWWLIQGLACYATKIDCNNMTLGFEIIIFKPETIQSNWLYWLFLYVSGFLWSI